MTKLTGEQIKEAKAAFTDRKTERKLLIAAFLTEVGIGPRERQTAISGVLSEQLADNIRLGVDGVVPEPGFTQIRDQLKVISALIG